MTAANALQQIGYALHSESPARKDEALDSAHVEIERLTGINKELVHSHNTLLIDGSRWQDRAERLRTVLQHFVEVDWYAAGTGRFEGRVSKEALDEAKAVFAAPPPS